MVREVAVRAAHGLRRPFSVDRRSSEHSLRRKKLASPARLESFDSVHQMELFRRNGAAPEGGDRLLLRRILNGVKTCGRAAESQKFWFASSPLRA